MFSIVRYVINEIEYKNLFHCSIILRVVIKIELRGETLDVALTNKKPSIVIENSVDG
jgi:hypothetical protein